MSAECFTKGENHALVAIDTLEKESVDLLHLRIFKTHPTYGDYVKFHNLLSAALTDKNFVIAPANEEIIKDFLCEENKRKNGKFFNVSFDEKYFENDEKENKNVS